MELLNLLMYPVYDVPEQIRRRIGFSGGTSALDSLIDVVARNGRGSIGSVEYQSALGGIVGFDQTSEGVERPLINVGDGSSVVGLDYNSSETGVYNFIAVMVANPINETRSQEIRYIVTGYTSQASPTLTGLLPDEMVLNINDIYGLRVTYSFNSHGQRVPVGYRMVDNFVLSQALSVTGYQETTVDLISVAKSADMVRKMNLNAGETFEPTQDVLFAPTTQTTAQLMANQLTRPDNFVTAISNSYLSTLGADDTLSTVDSFFEGSGAFGIQREITQLGVMRQFSNYDFVNAMRSALQRNTGQSEGSWKMANKAAFRLMDLRHAVNNAWKIDLDISTSLKNAHEAAAILRTEKTDPWVTPKGNSTQASLVAYDIAMALGPVLARSLVGDAAFTYDNYNSDFMTEANLAIIPNSTASISGGELPGDLANQFRNDLKAVFVAATKHNAIRCRVFIIAKLGTVNRIEIHVDGDLVPEYKTFASFMSSRLHSGNTTDLSYVGQLAVDTNRLMKAIDEGYNDHERTTANGRILSNIPTSPSSGSSLLGGSGITLGGGDDTFTF